MDAVIFNRSSITVLLLNIFTNKGIPIAVSVPLLHKPHVKVNELVVLHKKEPMNIILDENIPIKPIVKVDLKKVVEYKENEQTKEKEEETSFDDIENLLQ